MPAPIAPAGFHHTGVFAPDPAKPPSPHHMRQQQSVQSQEQHSNLPSDLPRKPKWAQTKAGLHHRAHPSCSSCCHHGHPVKGYQQCRDARPPTT